MLLTITTTHQPATDLGYLLHKHPERVQTFGLNFGQVHVFYPEASEQRCTVALLLDIDPVHLVRGRDKSVALEQYVNDRPYVASSFLVWRSLRSLALRSMGTAMPDQNWSILRCRSRPIWPSFLVVVMWRHLKTLCASYRQRRLKIFSSFSRRKEVKGPVIGLTRGSHEYHLS